MLEIELLENRRKLNKGELSSIAFAKKTRQAFLTDDQKARQLAEEVMEPRMAQTIPHLFGWLYFTYRLNDADKDLIINEHKKLNLILAKYFEEMYQKTLAYRLTLKHSKNT